MSNHDNLSDNPLGKVRAIAGVSDASGDWRGVFLHSRDRRPSDMAASALSDMMTSSVTVMLRKRHPRVSP